MPLVKMEDGKLVISFTLDIESALALAKRIGELLGDAG